MHAQIGRLVRASSTDVTRFQIKRLKEAARIVADAVKEVSSRFSRRIPASVEVKGDERGIYIQAGGPTAPNAYPFDPPMFPPPVFHPLFARRGSKSYTDGHWYAQPYRPFLEEGAAISADQAARAFSYVIDDWFKQSGLGRP
jgi:hypothetical protein